MLSILIPVYNYNILALVEEIHRQATACKIIFEIIIIDDCSAEVLFNIDIIKTFSNTELTILKHNIGRSAIRNLLADKANYENLLFIDAGTFPKSKTFLADYIKILNKDIIIGGMIEEEISPKKPYMLRWLYTKKRESYHYHKMNRDIYTSANFLIKKDTITSYPFDENIKKYGYEDFIFFNTLKVNGFHLNFIDNPVIHDCKEGANTFITKTEDGLRNLVQLSQKKTALLSDIKIMKVQAKLKKIGLSGVVISIYKFTKPLLIKNFNSSSPSILLFDFYRLGYLCALISSKE